jgi:hypothetical protein
MLYIIDNMKLINIRKIKIKLFIIFILFFNLSININAYAQDCGGFSCEEFSLQNLYDNALGLPNFVLTNNKIGEPIPPPPPPDGVQCQCTPVTVEQSCYCVYREVDNPEPIPEPEPEPEPVNVTEPTPSETGEGWLQPAICGCDVEELSIAPQCRIICADRISQEYVDSIPFCTSSDEHLAINPNDGTYYCTSE